VLDQIRIACTKEEGESGKSRQGGGNTQSAERGELGGKRCFSLGKGVTLVWEGAFVGCFLGEGGSSTNGEKGGRQLLGQ